MYCCKKTLTIFFFFFSQILIFFYFFFYLQKTYRPTRQLSVDVRRGWRSEFRTWNWSKSHRNHSSCNDGNVDVEWIIKKKQEKKEARTHTRKERRVCPSLRSTHTLKITLKLYYLNMFVCFYLYTHVWWSGVSSLFSILFYPHPRDSCELSISVPKGMKRTNSTNSTNKIRIIGDRS